MPKPVNLKNLENMGQFENTQHIFADLCENMPKLVNLIFLRNMGGFKMTHTSLQYYAEISKN